MKSSILIAFKFNLDYAQRLVADVDDDKFADQPAPGMNHPAWILGHLATTNDFVVNMLGGDATVCPEAWSPLFTQGTTPEPDRSKYPSKNELLAALDQGHTNLAATLQAADDDTLAKENPVEGMRPLAPTIGDLATFICTIHEMLHLGQLSAWRRASGLPRTGP